MADSNTHDKNYDDSYDAILKDLKEAENWFEKAFTTPADNVEPGGKAYNGGVQVGDHVTEIDGVNTENMYHTEALSAVKKAQYSLSLLLSRPDGDGNKTSNTVQSLGITPVNNSTRVSLMIGPKSGVSNRITDSKTTDDIPSDDLDIPQGQTYMKKLLQKSASHDDDLEPVERPRSKTLPKKMEAKQHVQETKPHADYSSKSLPRSQKSIDSSQKTPNWYRDMYKEMHTSMERESHLSKLLASDAKRGAFRKYDGASSTETLQSSQGRHASATYEDAPRRLQGGGRSIANHPNRKSLPNIHSSNFNFMKNPYDKSDSANKGPAIHSNWYRQIQKGGEIPETGLAVKTGDPSNTTTDKSARGPHSPKWETLVPAAGEDITTPPRKVDIPRPKSIAIEYNNPPDFLELRKQELKNMDIEKECEEIRMLRAKERLAEEEKMLEQKTIDFLKLEEEKTRLKLKEEELKRKEEQLLRQAAVQEERHRLRFQGDDMSEKMRRDAELRERERKEAEQREKERREMEMREAQRREAERLEAERREVERQEAERREANRREAERRDAERKEAERREVLRREAERREAEQREEEQREKERMAELEKNKPKCPPFGKAKYSFHPQGPGELSFKKGEVVNIIGQVDENWLEGEHKGKVGIFPITYVELFDSTSSGAEENAAKPDNSLNHIDDELLKEAENLANECMSNLPVKDEVDIVIKNNAPLESAPLDAVIVPGKESSLESVNLEVAPNVNGMQNGGNSSPSKLPSLIEEGSAIARYTFKAETETELSFKKGAEITLLKRVDDNWYEGELDGKIGILPVNYMKVKKEPVFLVKEEPAAVVESSPLSNVTKPKEVLKDIPMPADILKGKRQEERKNSAEYLLDSVLTAHAAEKKSKENPGLVNGYDHTNNSDGKNVIDDLIGQGETYKVIYKYAATNEDEIELFVGDIVHVLEKCDDNWYIGTSQRTGAFGTFPGNYVSPL